MTLKEKLKSIFWKYKQYKYTLENFLINIGLLKGDKNYTKFIVISRSRTGSSLIDHSLRNHPNVQSDGEIFNKLLGRNPKKLLNNFFSKKRNKVMAAGFKVFYYHPNDCDVDIWESIFNMSDIKFIHLMRKNKLEVLSSRKLAEANNTWHKTSDNSKEKIKTIRLSYEECLNDFNRIESYETKFNNILKNHEHIDVYYEDICKDYNKEMFRIQNFLNVENRTLDTELKKQGNKNISNTIINFNELKDKFENTKWESYFE